MALVTPFRKGALDEDALRRLCRHVLDQGVHGLFPTGCTGEAATLSEEERRRVWTVCVEEAAGRAKVVAGTGTNSTASTLALTRSAVECGVDGCMLITPYYNKPSPKGLLGHYRTVADAVDVPLVLYNVPGRTGLNMTPDVTEALAGHPRIVAIKEASGSVDQVTDILRRGADITVLSGDDTLTLPMVAAGARGVVSVVGHVAGDALVEMLQAHQEGRPGAAAERHRLLFSLTQALFRESNPGPVKALLAHLGVVANELRPPMASVSEETERMVEAAWRTYREARPAVSGAV